MAIYNRQMIFLLATVLVGVALCLELKLNASQSAPALPPQHPGQTGALPNRMATEVTSVLPVDFTTVLANGLSVDVDMFLGPRVRTEQVFDTYAMGTVLRPLSSAITIQWNNRLVGSSDGLTFIPDGSTQVVGMSVSISVEGLSPDASRPKPCMVTWQAKPRTKDWFSVRSKGDVVIEASFAETTAPR
jgi:hypothetical protein